MNRMTIQRAALSLFGALCTVTVTHATASATPRVNALPHTPATVDHLRPLKDGGSVTAHLHHIVTIGSTVDPQNGDQNPYGLAIAEQNQGPFTAGDLLICNFNDNLNIQGLGRTMEILHPMPGAKPKRFVADDRLTGCDAISIPDDANEPWVAAFTANDNPVLNANAKFELTLAGRPFAQPWGQTYSDTPGPFGAEAFYESNANDGSIVRIGISKKDRYHSRIIATGFSVNHGVPGTVLAPSGLTYDKENDTLYIVDGNVNRVVAFHHVTLIPPNGIIVKGNSFRGPARQSAEVVYRGAPLADPISAALLFNGNLVVGNTANNLLVEIDPTRHSVVHTVNLDKGPVGALFGIAATGTDISSTRIFFNDDNLNAVQALQR